jgi:hypothetical protein
VSVEPYQWRTPSSVVSSTESYETHDMEPYTAVTPGPCMYRTLEWQVTTYLCFFKTLSENRQIEQDVGVGELNERLPVSDFLRPASAKAATFGQPRNRALYHPSPRRVNLLRTLLGGRTLGSFGAPFVLGLTLM